MSILEGSLFSSFSFTKTKAQTSMRRKASIKRKSTKKRKREDPVPRTFQMGTRTISAASVTRLVHQVYRMKLKDGNVLDLEPDSPDRQKFLELYPDALKSEAWIEKATPEWFLPP